MEARGESKKTLFQTFVDCLGGTGFASNEFDGRTHTCSGDDGPTLTTMAAANALNARCHEPRQSFRDESSPLDAAASDRVHSKTVCSQTVESHANDTMNKKREASIRLAARNGHAEAVREHVINGRANVDMVKEEGCTPLHLAAANDHVDMKHKSQGSTQSGTKGVEIKSCRIEEVLRHVSDRTLANLTALAIAEMGRRATLHAVPKKQTDEGIHDSENNKRHSPNDYSLFKSFVEACIAGDPTALPRYPPDHPRHAQAECLFQFYNKPNAQALTDLSSTMQIYMDDVLLHTSTETGLENLLATFNNRFKLYDIPNNTFSDFKEM